MDTRNSAFDVVKFVSAFLVVCIHFAPHGNMLDAYMNAVCRIAVPLFFIISGYHYDSICSAGKFKTYILRIVMLTAFASVFYLLVYVVKNLPLGNLTDCFIQTLSFKNICLWIFFNAYPLADHLWYLYALIYTLIICVIIDELKLKKLLFYSAPVLLLIHGILNFECYNVYVRNWLFMGLPFVAIGRWLALNRVTVNRIDVSPQKLCIGIIVSFALLYVEMQILSRVNPCRDFYLSVVPIVVILTIIAVKKPLLGSSTFISHIGRFHTSFIYLYHIFFGNCFLLIAHKYDITFGHSLPIIIFVFTLSLSVLYSMIVKRIKK